MLWQLKKLNMGLLGALRVAGLQLLHASSTSTT